MKILVTGGGGFLGTYIVQELLNRKFEVVNLSRNSYIHLTQLGVNTLQCDLSDKGSVAELDLSGIDGVIHTAGIPGVWGAYDKYLKINYHGSINLLEAAKSAGIKYFVYTSTPSVVFGDEDILNGDEDLSYPDKFYTSYAKTKSMAEKEILEANSVELKTLAIRPHLIWGPGDPNLVPRIIEKARRGKLKRVGSGDNLVDIIYVENAASAHVDALTSLMDGNDIGGNAYFIGQESPVKLWDFIDNILTLNKLSPLSGQISFRAAYIIGWTLEYIYKILGILSPEPPMTRFVAMQLSKNHYFSHEKAKEDFGYNPKITTAEGLKRTFST